MLISAELSCSFFPKLVQSLKGEQGSGLVQLNMFAYEHMDSFN